MAIFLFLSSSFTWKFWSWLSHSHVATPAIGLIIPSCQWVICPPWCPLCISIYLQSATSQLPTPLSHCILSSWEIKAPLKFNIENPSLVLPPQNLPAPLLKLSHYHNAFTSSRLPSIDPVNVFLLSFFFYHHYKDFLADTLKPVMPPLYCTHLLTYSPECT